MKRLSTWILLGLLGLAATPRSGFSDEPKHASLAALRADYEKRARDLDRQKIKDLATLAASKTGEESDQAYDELFGLAMSRDLYEEALPAALVRRADADASMAERAMATLVSVIAKADQQKYDESLTDLARFFAENSAQGNDPNVPRLEEGTAIALGEAYLQRLFTARQYKVAKKLGDLIKQGVKRPTIQAHFAARMARLDLVGKAAPELEGTDVDGKAIKLADYRGKVVLINFWAAWCPPCLQELPDLVALTEAYGKDGFVILGVNLDAQHESMGSIEKARPTVRRLLVSAQISWPNILAGAGAGNPARIYGVTDIPANFLVGKDGNIVGFELMGSALKKAVAEELKK